MTLKQKDNLYTLWEEKIASINQPIHVKNLISLQVFCSLIYLEKWKTISSMFTPRAEGCAMLLLNKIYVFGGISTMKQYVQTI